VITSTDKAIHDQKNQFETDGSLRMSDLHNHAEYDASSVSVNVGTSMDPKGAWSPSGSGVGFGNDSGQADSDTRSGISGIAGNQNARTGDAQTGLKPIFNADKVQKDIDAQTLITQTFGQQASKTIGDFANAQVKSLKAQATQETDGTKRKALEDEAAYWDEGGAYRVALHTAMGGLLGGAGGAAGAGVSAASAPLLEQMQANITNSLKAAGLPEGAAKSAGSLISAGTASAVGGVLGGQAGAATGFDVDANNRQLHPSERKAILKYSASFAKKLSDYLGHHVTTDEAEHWLAEAAFANVDDAAMKAMNLLLPANAASEERQAYNQAKQYLFQIQKMEQNTALFNEKSPALYNNNFAGRNVNDPAYREFVWKNFGINEKPTNPTAQELATYNARDHVLRLNAIKNGVFAAISGGLSYGIARGLNKYLPISKTGAAVGANTGLNAAEGVVASRVNVRTGDANITGSGLEYAWKKHGGAWGENKSAFTISKDELKVALQDPLVVNTPAYQSATSGNYIRTVDMGRTVGIDAKTGGKSTNFMTVITDSKGNLVNTFPGKTF